MPHSKRRSNVGKKWSKRLFFRLFLLWRHYDQKLIFLLGQVSDYNLIIFTYGLSGASHKSFPNFLVYLVIQIIWSHTLPFRDLYHSWRSLWSSLTNTSWAVFSDCVRVYSNTRMVFQFKWMPFLYLSIIAWNIKYELLSCFCTYSLKPEIFRKKICQSCRLYCKTNLWNILYDYVNAVDKNAVMRDHALIFSLVKEKV